MLATEVRVLCWEHVIGSHVRRLMEAVWSLPELCNFRKQLIDSNSQRDEWLILSHDATFKSLFTFLGQEKMNQQEDEFHALHSVLGITGALAGLSLQSSEGPDSFSSAMCDILPLSARQKTRWIFTDTSSTIAKAATCLPHLLGIAEDPLHLVLRIEGCFGEKRTKLSSLLLAITKEIYRCLQWFNLCWRETSSWRWRTCATFPLFAAFFPLVLQQCLSWLVSAQPRSRDISLEMKTYTCTMLHRRILASRSSTASRSRQGFGRILRASPYEQHQQYINDIFDLTLDYAQDMNRKNSKGKSAKQILIAGCAYQHFRYLQNGSCAIFTLSSEHKRLLSMGTTANEALHAQFNACQRPVVQQHVESMDVVLRSFSLGKLLSHHSAAFSPTLVQRSQGQILSLLEGKLQQSNYHFLAPFGANIPGRACSQTAAASACASPWHRCRSRA